MAEMSTDDLPSFTKEKPPSTKKQEQSKSILEYYRDGGDPSMHKSRRAEYRQKFMDWSASLNHYYNRKGLKVSRHMLIKAMRDSRLTPEKIPSARFADAWLSRSVYKQIFRPIRTFLTKPISSKIAYRPNQLMQADTMFVLRKEAEGIDAIFMLPKAKQQLALQGIKAGEATALVTCIDTLTGRGYA